MRNLLKNRWKNVINTNAEYLDSIPLVFRVIFRRVCLPITTEIESSTNRSGWSAKTESTMNIIPSWILKMDFALCRWWRVPSSAGLIPGLASSLATSKIIPSSSRKGPTTTATIIAAVGVHGVHWSLTTKVRQHMTGKGPSQKLFGSESNRSFYEIMKREKERERETVKE